MKPSLKFVEKHRRHFFTEIFLIEFLNCYFYIDLGDIRYGLQDMTNTRLWLSNIT
jgi:hypothetical protein